MILFEMLVGYPPFFSDDPATTCQKILNWRKTLMIPAEANLTPESIDLLRRLLSDSCKNSAFCSPSTCIS